MKRYNITRAIAVNKELTEAEYAVALLGDIEAAIKTLEKFDTRSFKEWDTHIEQLTEKFSKINERAKGCNILA